MRGEVLYYDEAQGFGFIQGADGNRYTLARENLRRDTALAKGTTVEFQPNGDRARDVFVVRAQTGGSTPAVPAADATARPQPQFGRLAEDDLPRSTGLWSYFWRGLTANYVNFRDRARRKEYWGFGLFWVVGLLVVTTVGLFIDLSSELFDEEGPLVTAGLCGLFVLVTFFPALAVTIRRIHDIGLSGWFYLLVFIPYIGALIILVFMLVPTQKRENEWGPVPAGIRF